MAKRKCDRACVLKNERGFCVLSKCSIDVIDDDLFQVKLDNYLKKCEIEFCAHQRPRGHYIDWIAEDCDTVEHIASRLRELGFKIRRIVDEEPWPGEVHQWVETSSGIIVYANTKGLVAKAVR